MRVLLIDDEEMVRKVVRQMLERGGHDVTEAENGRIGLELLKAGTFDLAITDIVMPEVKGLDMLMTVRQLYPRMKVIVMSGGDRNRHYRCPGRSGKARSLCRHAQAHHAQRPRGRAQPHLRHVTRLMKPERSIAITAPRVRSASVCRRRGARR
jgi:CheY-like chemotaxis protein